jgi:tetratricopeptide (TPR) repeat protein
MVIEDLHWIDKSSEEALRYVLESISGSKIVLIFTYRPEFVHTWGGRSYHSQINLNRLSNRESLAMVNYLLGTEDIESELENLILEKTEGVPFFIEEFLKSIKDLIFIERKDNKYRLMKDIQDLVIPSTIQDIIMARVDSLPEGAKEVLQTGSVIEREFSYELIKRVTALSEKELLHNLSVLKDSELLFERGLFPESFFIFKHAVTREVVYDSILTGRKMRFHEDIGNAIEELHKENIEEYYGILAEHYMASENYAKGAELCRLAGRRAENAVSFTDAIAYGEKWVACLERLPRTEYVEKRIIDARTTLGLYLNQMNYHVEAKEAVEPAVELALERDNKRRTGQIHTIIGAYSHVIEEDIHKSVKHLEEAIKIAKDTNDFISLLLANHYMGHVLESDCEFEKGLYHLERALEIVEMANVLWSISVHKSCIARTIYFSQGKMNLSYQFSNEGLQLAEESDDIYSKAEAYVSHGFSCYGKGFLDEAEGFLSKGSDFCERINFITMNVGANLLLGDTYFDMRKYQKSKAYYDNAIQFMEQNRILPSMQKLSKMAVARAKVMNNEKDINLESLYGYEAENKVTRIQSLMQRYISEILLNIDDEHISDAEDWIKKAIEADEKNDTRFDLGKDYALYAELFKRKGDQSKTKENLIKAIEILKECGADGWVEKYEKELDALS